MLLSFILAVARLPNSSGVVEGDHTNKNEERQDTPTPTATTAPTPTLIPTPTPSEEIVLEEETEEEELIEEELTEEESVEVETTTETTTEAQTTQNTQTQSSGVIQNVRNFIFGLPTPSQRSTTTTTTKRTVKKTAPRPTPVIEETFKVDLVKTQLELTTEKIDNLKRVGLSVPGLAETVDGIITEHNDFSQRVDTEVVKVQNRPRIVKVVLGPNYNALKELNRLLANNSSEILKLQNLLFKVSEPSDITSIKAAVSAIQLENEAIQDQIDTESNQPSVFGFVMKWISR